MELADELRKTLIDGEYNNILSQLEFSNDDNLLEIGLDSMSYLTFLVDLEDKFEIVFDVEELDFSEINTINKIAELVKQKKEEG